jgi:poly(A) polymerase
LRAGIMRTIGKPSIRFEEDPVRILRAVKFASRLGFEIEPETRAAMAEIAPDIMRCPVPRVTEEVYRLVESGYFLRAVEVMDETDVLSVLLPEIAAELEMNRDGYRKHLEALDHVVRAHHRVAREFLLTALYYPLAMSIVDEGDAGPGWGKDVEEWFRPIGVRMHIAVKHRYRMRALLSLMGRFLAPPNEKRRSRLSTHDRRVLPQALTLLRIHHHAQGGVADIYERWRTVAAENQITWVPVADTGGDSVDGERRDGSRRQKGRRRRRGRRRDEEAQ